MRISLPLDRLAHRRAILILFALFIVFSLVVFPIFTGQINRLSGGTGLIDGEFSYTPEKVFQMVEAYGPQGRPLYALMTLTADLLYPAIYGLFFVLLLYRTFGRLIQPESPFQGLVYLPFITMVADYLENACIVTMLAVYPQRPEFVAQAASLFTSLKWGLLLACIGLAGIGLAGWVIELIRNGRKK